LVAGLLLALAGGAVLTIAAGARRTDTAYARLLRSEHAADAEIAVSGSDSRQNLGGVSNFYAAVARLPAVAVVAPTAGVDAMVVGRRHASLLLKGGTDARLGQVIERPKLTQGRQVNPARPEEVLADRSTAAQLHLHVGDTLHLLAGPSSSAGVASTEPMAVIVRVVGIAVTRDNVVPVTALGAEGSLLVTPGLLRRLGPPLYAYDAAFVRLRPDVSVSTFRRSAKALVRRYPETGGQLFVVDEHEQAAKVEDAIRPQTVALVLFALLVALASLFIVGQVFIRQVFVASGDHSTLRALGVSRVQLTAVGLAEVGAAVVVGAAFAGASAALLSPVMPVGPARVAEPQPGWAVNWSILGFGVVAIVVVFVLLVAVPIWRRAGESARSLGSSPRTERPSMILEWLHRAGAPASVAVGARLALEPGRGRTAVPVRSTLAVTTVAVAAVAAAFTFGTNLVRLVDTPSIYGQNWQLSVDVGFDQIPRRAAETFLRDQPGVAGWTFGNHAEATIAGRRVAAIEMTHGNGPAVFPTLIDGRTPRAPNETVLGARTLEAAHVHVGQTVPVTLPGENAPRALRIVGRAVFPFFGQGEVTPTGLGNGAALLDPGRNPNGFNFVLVNMTPDRDEPANVVRLAHNLTTAGLCPQACVAVTRQRPADVNNFARITATPLVLAGVLAVLALAAVAHLLVTSIRRRRHDFAIFKTLGLLRRQVSAAVAWQATIVVALAVLVGIPLGIIAGRWAWIYFATRLGIAADPEVPTILVLASIAVALVVANVVAAFPAWLAARLQPGPVLRTE
jgi:hypothetical protein